MGFDSQRIFTNINALLVVPKDKVLMGESPLQFELWSNTDFPSLKKKIIIAQIVQPSTIRVPFARLVRSLTNLIHLAPTRMSILLKVNFCSTIIFSRESCLESGGNTLISHHI